MGEAMHLNGGENRKFLGLYVIFLDVLIGGM